MESACQVKGCKNNKKPTKSDESRVQQHNKKASHNNNGSSSDEEHNEEVVKKSPKKNLKNNNNSNNMNNKNHKAKSNDNGKVQGHHETTAKPNEASKSKAVSSKEAATTSETSKSKVAAGSKETSTEVVAAAVSDKAVDATTNTEVASDATTGPAEEVPQVNVEVQKVQKVNPDLQQRHAVLSYEQVCRLNDVMNEVVSIHGRGNFPTLEVKLRDLVTVVRSKLEEDPSNGGAGMKVRDIRLNGGCASHVLATESQPYNDLDLIFGVELSNSRNYDKVKAAVLGSLFDLLPEGVSRKRITTCSLKEAYVSKMVKVSNDGDRWSLISLGNSRGHRTVELKFVDTMRRQFEFSVDSFQIVLDSLLNFPECSTVQMNEIVYPTVVGESVYGDFHEAIYHLQKKLISTRHPEEIRGGGLLKYCNLLVKMYKPAQPDYIKTLERYMCSRFFIDFPDISQQRAKLENYLWNHFVGPEEEALKYQYLMLLHSVVEESTVCLMGHERRQTLGLIENLAYQVLCQEQQQRLTNHQAPAAYVYANGYYYAPVIPTACYTCTCNSWMATCSS